MNIYLDGIGKKFNTEWIFRDVSLELCSGESCAILGRNGSGKSTLLQIIAGNIHPSSGKIIYKNGNTAIPDTIIFRHLAMVAPYMEIIEDFTLDEMLRFHFAFKNLLPGMNLNGVKEILDLRARPRKTIKQFSSGMKQRVKLAMAVLSDVPLLLLDEPLMNLDNPGVEWYIWLIREYCGGRTVVVCSNHHEQESLFAQKVIRIEKYKMGVGS